MLTLIFIETFLQGPFWGVMVVNSPVQFVPVVYARLFRGFAKKNPFTIPMVLRVKYCWSRLYGKAHRSSPRSLHVGLRAAVLKPPLGHISFLGPRDRSTG